MCPCCLELSHPRWAYDKYRCLEKDSDGVSACQGSDVLYPLGEKGSTAPCFLTTHAPLERKKALCTWLWRKTYCWRINIWVILATDSCRREDTWKPVIGSTAHLACTRVPAEGGKGSSSVPAVGFVQCPGLCRVSFIRLCPHTEALPWFSSPGGRHNEQMSG